LTSTRRSAEAIGIALVFIATGCSGGLGDFSLPSSQPDPLDGQSVEAGLKVDSRTREPFPFFPAAAHGFAVPEFAVTSDLCDELPDGGTVNGPDCVTDTLSCGQTIIGHTLGGVNRYDSDYYEEHFCTPATTDHDGGDERVYALEVPDQDWTAVITLDSPCADLDLAAMWPGTNRDEDTCPARGELFDRCDLFPKDGNAREQLRLVTDKASTWYIVVEGKGDEEGLFALTVQCRPGLM